MMISKFYVFCVLVMILGCQKSKSTIQSVSNVEIQNDCDKPIEYNPQTNELGVAHARCYKYSSGSVDKPTFGFLHRKEIFLVRDINFPKDPKPCKLSIAKTLIVSAQCEGHDKKIDLGKNADAFLKNPKLEFGLVVKNANSFQKFKGEDDTALIASVYKSGSIMFAPVD